MIGKRKNIDLFGFVALLALGFTYANFVINTYNKYKINQLLEITKDINNEVKNEKNVM